MPATQISAQPAGAQALLAAASKEPAASGDAKAAAESEAFSIEAAATEMDRDVDAILGLPLLGPAKTEFAATTGNLDQTRGDTRIASTPADPNLAMSGDKPAGPHAIPDGGGGVSAEKTAVQSNLPARAATVAHPVANQTPAKTAPAMAGTPQDAIRAAYSPERADPPTRSVAPDAAVRLAQSPPAQTLPQFGPDERSTPSLETGQSGRMLMSEFGPVERIQLQVDPASSPTRIDPSPRHVTPQAVVQQLANVAASHPDQHFELTLSPEELGRVRLSLHTADGGITVSVLTERPETGDLLRRNIDLLAQEFGEIGYSDVTFEFGQHDGQTDQPEQPGTERETPPDAQQTEPVVTLALDPPERLDLRL